MTSKNGRRFRDRVLGQLRTESVGEGERRPDLPPKSLALAKEYFKSTTDFVIYTLLETDGRSRCDNLGIREIHYSDKQAANEWKLSVRQYLHPNDTAALAKLEKLYLNMVDSYV